MTRVTLVVASSMILLAIAIAVAILLTRGYQFNLSTKSINPTGILVAASDPNGAEVFINDKLTTATNNSINLPPGDYTVRIALEGYTPWEKKVSIKAEEVYKTNAFLFPKVPDLRPMTLAGALNPAFSPDQAKIVYGVSSASGQLRNGIWIADMSRATLPGPLGGGADLRQIYRDTAFSLASARFLWSPDSRQIIAYLTTAPTIATPSARPVYLLDADRLNEAPLLLGSQEQITTLTDWRELADSRRAAQIAKLSPDLAAILASSSANLTFSPDESKILFTATASAVIPPFLTTYLPGRNPTTETRLLVPGRVFVYDLKEDRNYLIENCQPAENQTKAGKLPAPLALNKVEGNSPNGKTVNCFWFPSSRHILAFSGSEIDVMEYDGSNKSVVYAGPFVDAVVFPFPNWGKIVILTSLNQSADVAKNLYTINLR